MYVITVNSNLLFPNFGRKTDGISWFVLIGIPDHWIPQNYSIICVEFYSIPSCMPPYLLYKILPAVITSWLSFCLLFSELLSISLYQLLKEAVKALRAI